MVAKHLVSSPSPSSPMPLPVNPVFFEFDLSLSLIFLSCLPCSCPFVPDMRFFHTISRVSLYSRRRQAPVLWLLYRFSSSSRSCSALSSTLRHSPRGFSSWSLCLLKVRLRKVVCFQLPPPAPLRVVCDIRTCSAVTPLFLQGGVLWRIDVHQSVPTGDLKLYSTSWEPVFYQYTLSTILVHS